MIGYSELLRVRDQRRALHALTEVEETECPECGGEGKIGVFVTDPHDEAECPVCHGKGEV